MERFQHFRKINFIAIFILIITSCSPSKEEITYTQLSQLIGEEVLKQEKHIIVLMPIRCQGCVEEKLIEFINLAPETDINSVLFVYDTTVNNNLADYNQHLRKKIYKPNKEIQKYFPENANMYIYKIDNKKQTAQGKILNPEDLGILHQLN